MSLQTLPFYPQPNYTVASEPRRKVLDFGDGYQQRRAEGLNPLQRTFQCEFNLNHSQAQQLLDFLTVHSGVTAFYFKPHRQSKAIKVVCPKWTEAVKLRHNKISCEFEEVV